MELIKVVINTEYGGFSVSKKGLKHIRYLAKKDGMSEKKINKLYPYGKYGRNIERHDKYLAQTVMDLGPESYGDYARLNSCIIPSIFEHYYEIDEYDGAESVEYSKSDIISHTIEKLSHPETLSPEECQKTLIELYELQHTKFDAMKIDCFEDYFPVVINEGTEEFSINEKVWDHMLKLAGDDVNDESLTSRENKYLVQAVKELGSDAGDLAVYNVFWMFKDCYEIVKINGVETIVSTDPDDSDIKFYKITKIIPSEYY